MHRQSQDTGSFGNKPVVKNDARFPVSTNSGKSKTEQMEMVIRVQSLIRGFLERRRYKRFQAEMKLKHTLYFKNEEMMETLNSGQIYDPNAPLAVKRIDY